MLLLGADGQVGFELHRALAPLGEVVAATRRGHLPGGIPCERGDLAEPGVLAALIERSAPAWIVNAAAYTAVDKAESEPEAAQRVNGEALGLIGQAARRLDAAVLHFSTDYVFPGNGSRPYREDDTTAPLGAYGRSKLAGEVALRESGARHLILRTAWIYAARGSNFLRTMLRVGAARDSLNVVDDQRGSPTSARQLAQAAAYALREATRFEPATFRAPAQPPWGVYHVAAAGETSWHGFASEIFALALRAGLIARAPEVRAIPSSEYPTPAQRPAYSVLDRSRFEARFGLHLSDWRAGLAACIGELAEQAQANRAA